MPFGAIETAGLKALGFDRLLCAETATGEGKCDVNKSLGEKLGGLGCRLRNDSCVCLKRNSEYNPKLDIEDLINCSLDVLIEDFDGSIKIAEMNDEENFGTLVSVIRNRVRQYIKFPFGRH